MNSRAIFRGTQAAAAAGYTSQRPRSPPASALQQSNGSGNVPQSQPVHLVIPTIRKDRRRAIRFRAYLSIFTLSLLPIIMPLLWSTALRPEGNSFVMRKYYENYPTGPGDTPEYESLVKYDTAGSPTQRAMLEEMYMLSYSFRYLEPVNIRHGTEMAQAFVRILHYHTGFCWTKLEADEEDRLVETWGYKRCFAYGVMPKFNPLPIDLLATVDIVFHEQYMQDHRGAYDDGSNDDRYYDDVSLRCEICEALEGDNMVSVLPDWSFTMSVIAGSILAALALFETVALAFNVFTAGFDHSFLLLGLSILHFVVAGILVAVALMNTVELQRVVRQLSRTAVESPAIGRGLLVVQWVCAVSSLLVGWASLYLRATMGDLRWGYKHASEEWNSPEPEPPRIEHESAYDELRRRNGLLPHGTDAVALQDLPRYRAEPEPGTVVVDVGHDAQGADSRALPPYTPTDVGTPRQTDSGDNISSMPNGTLAVPSAVPSAVSSIVPSDGGPPSPQEDIPLDDPPTYRRTG